MRATFPLRLSIALRILTNIRVEAGESERKAEENCDQTVKQFECVSSIKFYMSIAAGGFIVSLSGGRLDPSRKQTKPARQTGDRY